MDRRQFHKAILAGAVAAAGSVTEADSPAAAGGPAPSLPHPGDVPPAGASIRLGTNRFWHLVDRGNDGVNALAFSPDGRLLAALGYQDGCISLWEVPSGRMIRKWAADHADRCGELAFSPCGRFLAVGSDDGLRLWDPHTGRLVRQFADRQTIVYGVAFSPCGQFLAAAMPFDGAVDLWDVASGERVARFEADPHPICPDAVGEWSDWFNCVAFSSDGRLVAAGSKYEIYHDVEGPEADALQQQLMDKHGSWARKGWGESPIYVCEPRGRVWCWGRASGQRLAKLEGHEFPVVQVRFTRDGRLVSSAKDGAVWVWDVEAGRRIGEVGRSVNQSYRTSAAFAAGGRHAILSQPGSLSLIDLADGSERQRFAVSPNWGGCFHLAVSAAARWVATASVGRISLWDASTGRDASPPARHTGWVEAVRFTADGRRVVTATQGEAILWDAATGGLLRQVRFDGFLSEQTLALAPDGLRAAGVLSRYEGDPPAVPIYEVAVWDWESGTLRTWRVGPDKNEEGLTALAWSAEGESVVVGTGQGEVYVLDLRTGRRDRHLDGVTDGVLSVAVSPNGRFAAALGAGARVHVWELAPGGWRNRLDGPALPSPRSGCYGPLGRLAFAPDCRNLVLTAGQGHVCAGPLDGRELPLVFTTPRPLGLSVGAFVAEFLSDGRLLAAGAAVTGDDAEEGPDTAWVWVWDVVTGQEIWAAPPQRYPVTALAFSPDGRTLASGGWDGTALLWDLGAAVSELRREKS